jgi:drug/metabolite transporter (DMT)-like permease
MSNRPWLPLAAVATTLLLWSSAFVAIRHLGHDFPAGALSLGRLAVGAVALAVVAVSRGLPRPSPRDWAGLVAVGVLWFGVYNVALNQGEHHVDAGTSAMLIQLSPVLIALFATLFLGERFTGWLAAGLALAFAGVVLIGVSQPGGHRDIAGVVLCLFAALVYAVALVVQKPLVSRLSALHVTWLACTIGAVACLPFGGQLVTATRHASASDIWWVVYLGLFPTAIAFTTYAFALRHMTASSLGITTYLVPPLTIALSWVLLGETPPAVAYAGGALALVGVAVARRVPRGEPATTLEPRAGGQGAGRAGPHERGATAGCSGRA